MKKILVIAAAMAALTLSCSKKDSTTPSTTDTNSSTTSPTTTSSDGKTTVANGVTTITGTKDYEFKVIGKGNYILTIKEKASGNITDFQYWSAFEKKYATWASTNATTASASGYYETTDMGKITDDTIKGKITATGEYIVEFKKLPSTATAAALPKSYTGAGRSVFGPFSLTTQANIVLTCADAKNAGLSLQLFDATGDEILSEEYGPLYSNFKDGKFVNNISQTITKTGLTAGAFYINVDANGAANYTVDVK